MAQQNDKKKDLKPDDEKPSVLNDLAVFGDPLGVGSDEAYKRRIELEKTWEKQRRRQQGKEESE
jgi:hypothetical protein